MASTVRPNASLQHWDLEADIVVVGWGLAGGVAAIEAHDVGASVILLEKMPEDGGISRIAGGGARVATDWEAAFEELKTACGGRTPDDVLEALAKGMTEIPDYLRKLALTDGAELSPDGGSIRDIPGYDPMRENPSSPGYRGGARMMKVIRDNIAARKIDVRLSTPAKRLIADDSRRVLGIVAENNGVELNIKARKGVILTCGGFEGDSEMIKHYFEAQPLMVSGFLGNTGDGIRMAQDLGADLWHMWHFHGSYGFLVDPEQKLAARTFKKAGYPAGDPPGPEKLESGRDGLGGALLPRYATSYVLPWILVDQTGRRYMNEYPPYLQDNSHRPMAHFDSQTETYPRIPSFLIVDDDGLHLDQLGLVTLHDPFKQHELWSSDNSKEFEKGILNRANSIEEIALNLGIQPNALTATVKRWNEFCERGGDDDFGRPPSSLVPIRKPPYTYSEVWPMITNTHGGPRHDKFQRVLNVWGEPIPRLYAAGELGGGFWPYLSGGRKLCRMFRRRLDSGAACPRPRLLGLVSSSDLERMDQS